MQHDDFVGSASVGALDTSVSIAGALGGVPKAPNSLHVVEQQRRNEVPQPNTSEN